MEALFGTPFHCLHYLFTPVWLQWVEPSLAKDVIITRYNLLISQSKYLSIGSDIKLQLREFL